MRTYFIAPTRPSVGLTSVSLGLVRALQRQGLKVAYVKPVTKTTPQTEPSALFVRSICGVDSPDPLPMDDVTQYLTAGRMDELLERLVGMAMAASDDADVLLVEGLHPDPTHAYIPRLSGELAISLQADVVLVASAADAQGIAEAKDLVALVRNSRRRVVGVIFNKAAASFDAARASAELGDVPVWGVIRADPRLSAPRTLDLAQHLGAEVLATSALPYLHGVWT